MEPYRKLIEKIQPRKSEELLSMPFFL